MKEPFTISIDGFEFRVYDITGSLDFEGNFLIVTTEKIQLNRLERYCTKDERYSYMICRDEKQIIDKMQELYDRMERVTI